MPAVTIAALPVPKANPTAPLRLQGLVGPDSFALEYEWILSSGSLQGGTTVTLVGKAVGEFELLYLDSRTSPDDVLRVLAPQEQSDLPSLSPPEQVRGSLRERLTWLTLMFQELRSEDELAPLLDALVDELFRRYAQRVADAPKDHAMDYTHAYLHAEKTAFVP